MKKRLFSILLVLCMALTMLPVTALAGVVSEAGDISIKNLRWKFENDGEVVYYISDGNGEFTQTQPESGSYLKLTKNDKEITATVVGDVEITAHGISCDTVWTYNSLLINGNGSLIVKYKEKKSGQNYTAIEAYSLTVDGISLTAEASMGYAIYAFEGIEIKNGASLEAKSGYYAAIREGISDTDGNGITGGITVENATLTATATGWGEYPALMTYGNVTVTNSVVNAVNRASERATIEAKYKNSVNCLYVSGTSTITATNESTSENLTSKAITATIWNNNTNAKIEVNGSEVKAQDRYYSNVKNVTIISPAPHTHTFDNTWTSDATDHWHACTASDCNGIDAIKDKAAHTGGTATCTAKKVCTVCNQPYGELDPNNHTALSDWTSDATGHWKVCTDCKATDIVKASHTYGEWQITQGATATEAGSQYRECSVCHYKETVTIPATGPCTHEGTLKYTDNGDWSTHKVECIACGQVINAKEAHAIHGYRINDVAGTHQEFCNKCSYNGPVLHHSNFIYVSDGDSHYKKCGICGVRTGMKEAHNFENGSCTACGAADPTYVPPTDPAPVEPTPGGSVIIITPEATGPVFLSGANQTVALGSAAAFRIDYNYAAFRSVAVDGVTLTPADYTTWEGSTWVKLTPAYVKTLGIGTHTLSVYFDGATATTTFTVGSQPNPATGARDAVGIAAVAAVIALLGSAALLRKK